MGAENGTASGSRAGTRGIDRCDGRLRGRPGASQMIWSVSFLAKKTCGLSGRPAMHNELGCYNYRLGEKREGRPPGTYTNLHRGHPLRRLPRPPVTHPGRHLSQHGSRSAAQGAKRRRAIGRREPPTGKEAALHFGLHVPELICASFPLPLRACTAPAPHWRKWGGETLVVFPGVVPLGRFDWLSIPSGLVTALVCWPKLGC